MPMTREEARRRNWTVMRLRAVSRNCFDLLPPEDAQVAIDLVDKALKALGAETESDRLAAIRRRSKELFGEALIGVGESR